MISIRQALERSTARLSAEDGFTLIELVVTMMIIATSFLALTLVLSGTLAAYSSARSRSSFVEIANAELENLRAIDYDLLGVRADDPDYGSAYPLAQFEGRDAVVVTDAGAPAAVTVVTTSSVEDVPVPYTVRRWVTWTDVTPDTLPDAHVFKRLTVRLEWRDKTRTRTFQLTSVRYPGGIGAPTDTANNAPVAALEVTAPSPTSVNDSVAFDASGSTDADGDVLEYEWDFGDGSPHLVGPLTTTHVYSLAGPYSVTMMVTDGRGGVGTTVYDLVVVAAAGNQPPSASFTQSRTSGMAPLEVNFDASGSTDPDGTSDIVSYRWDWGDGSAQGIGINASHIFETVTTAVTYTVTLTVTDRANQTDTATGVVLVTPLTCTVTGGSFRNPVGNSTADDIEVHASRKPKYLDFVFTATTNTACTSVTAELPKESGSFTVTLTTPVTTGGVVTWTGYASIDSNQKFNVGNGQTGYIRAPVATGGESVFTFPFNVHS